LPQKNLLPRIFLRTPNLLYPAKFPAYKVTIGAKSEISRLVENSAGDEELSTSPAC